MNLQVRPVNCYTKQPLIFLPGFINTTIYSNQIEAGWSWNAYQQNNKQLEVRDPVICQLCELAAAR